MTMLAVDGRSLKIGDYVDPVEREPVCAAVPMPQRWFILRLHPNRELAVQHAFEREGLSGYLPFYRRDVAVHRGYRVVIAPRLSPVFPGMMFVPDFEARIDRLRRIDGVSSFLRLGERVVTVTPAMIAAIRALEAEMNIPLGKRKRLFAAGQLVRITDGPFEQWRGRIERLDGAGRIKVLIDAITREVPVNVTEDQVEAV